ncbi:MAG: hypothetical protein IJ834_01440 [Paludibacteraceae bacterium]|nr:hypothetical protein [Paludibacteraceae bacterium]
MTLKLFFQALTKFLAGLLLVCLLLFLPAGTFDYPQAWRLIGLLFTSMIIAGVWLMINQPELLSRRLNTKEEQHEQKWVVALSGLLFVAMFVVAGLGRRFDWYMLPDYDWITYPVIALFLTGYGLYFQVLRENIWLSRTIKVQQDQKVISTGLYGKVRHPMYAATLLLFLSMPLVAVMLLYVPIIALRIRNEEQVLERDLKGYKEYKQQVRYKVIPYIW